MTGYLRVTGYLFADATGREPTYGFPLAVGASYAADPEALEGAMRCGSPGPIAACHCLPWDVLADGRRLHSRTPQLWPREDVRPYLVPGARLFTAEAAAADVLSRGPSGVQVRAFTVVGEERVA